MCATIIVYFLCLVETASCKPMANGIGRPYAGTSLTSPLALRRPFVADRRRYTF